MKHDLRHIHHMFYQPRHENLENLLAGALQNLVFASNVGHYSNISATVKHPHRVYSASTTIQTDWRCFVLKFGVTHFSNRVPPLTRRGNTLSSSLQVFGGCFCWPCAVWEHVLFLCKALHPHCKCCRLGARASSLQSPSLQTC